MVKERRERNRVGNRIPEHQRAMRPLPIVRWGEWDQYHASQEGWVLYMNTIERRVMPRTIQKGATIFATDAEAEAYVEARAFNAVDQDGIHCRAIEFRDRCSSSARKPRSERTGAATP